MRKFAGISALFFVGFAAVAILSFVISERTGSVLDPVHFDVAYDPTARSTTQRKWPYDVPPCSGERTEAYVKTHFVDFPPPSQSVPCELLNSYENFSYVGLPR
jgi:hypothetical protein